MTSDAAEAPSQGPTGTARASRPVIVAVDDDAGVLAAVRTDLRSFSSRNASMAGAPPPATTMR